MGPNNARAIDEYFLGSWDDFERAIKEEFCFFHIAGVSQTLSRNIYNWYADEAEAKLWRPVLKEITFVNQPVKVGAAGNPFVNANVVVTGTVNGMNRKDITELLTFLGANVNDSVTKNTTYLIVGEAPGAKKLSTALNYGTKIITEGHFAKMLSESAVEEEDYVYLYSLRRFNEYSLADLINNEITVSPSKNMNDPFDSIINLWGTKELLKKTCKEHKHIKNLSKSFDYFRIRSFCNGNTTRALKNILMWSHYADNHRGYCIKYKLSKYFIKQENNDSFEHMFLKPIIYRKDKVDISEMTTINTDLAFATKHRSWKYENEVRLIVYNPNKEDAFYGIPLDKDSCIEAIYFGCKCDPKTINTIKNLFSKADIPPKFFKVYSESKDVYQLKWDKSV